MGINGEFFLKFLEPFFGGLVAFFKAIGAAIVKIFNIATYFDIIKEYKAKGSSTFTNYTICCNRLINILISKKNY